MLALHQPEEKKFEWALPLIMKTVTTSTVPDHMHIINPFIDHESQAAKTKLAQELTNCILKFNPTIESEARKIVELVPILFNKGLIDQNIQEKLSLLWAQAVTNPQNNIGIPFRILYEDEPQAYAPLLFSTLAYVLQIPPTQPISNLSLLVGSAINALKDQIISEQLIMHLKNIMCTLLTHEPIVITRASIKTLIELVKKIDGSTIKNNLLLMISEFLQHCLPVLDVTMEDQLLLCIEVWKMLIDIHLSLPSITEKEIKFFLVLLEQAICKENWSIKTEFMPLFEKLIDSLVKTNAHHLLLPIAIILLKIISDNEKFLAQYEAQILLEKIIDAVPFSNANCSIWTSLFEIIGSTSFAKTADLFTPSMIITRCLSNVDFSEISAQDKQLILTKTKQNIIHHITALQNGPLSNGNWMQSIAITYAAKFIRCIKPLEKPLKETFLRYYLANIPQLEAKKQIYEYAQSVFGEHLSSPFPNDGEPHPTRTFCANESGTATEKEGPEGQNFNPLAIALYSNTH